MDWQLRADAHPTFVIPREYAPSQAPVPVTGAWRSGDPVGNRRFAQIGEVRLDTGGTLPRVTLAYETWGTLNDAADNAILVFHALTGDSHVTGESGAGHATSGWWSGVVGPGLALDTDRYFVVCPNVLGGCQGSTGPASTGLDARALGSRFPRVTIRDQVRASQPLMRALGIRRWHSVIGGSMGGMHALEWGIMFPDSLRRLAVLAAPAATTADQIAQNTLQLEALRLDPHWADGDYYDQPAGFGPHRGLALARRMALLGYRSASELNERFARNWQSDRNPASGGRYRVESYLDVHGNRFPRRFDAGSYMRLVDAMSSHDIGRGRVGVAAALSRIRVPTLVVGIDSDRLFPLADQQAFTPLLSKSITGAEPAVLHSVYGHDGFLIEDRAVATLLRELLNTPA